MKRHLSFYVLLFFIATQTLIAQTQPPLFTNTLVSNTWDEIEGFVWDSTGQQYVWEKAGVVWIVDTNGNKLPQPLIDIHDEVGNWRDHGLNGFALDPNFRTNGYFYLYYTVDRHHLLYFGTPTYNVDSNWYFEATIARVTRYTANSATNFTTTIANSRQVLIGETKKTGMVVLFDTHSGGSLVFGKDGSLLVSTGDGASPATADSGKVNPALSYWPAAMTDSMMTAKQNVGAYRSQLVDCLNGKILRVDPATGNGLPSNPFYDSSDARAAKSRVWALGLRNPFRVILKPGTGSTDITAGDPGTLYIGDVGWQFWEDVNVCNEAGQNFGWPVYQGFDLDPNYFGSKQYNFDAPNPLFGVNGCTKPYFTFHELIQNPTANGVLFFPNPCNTAIQIPSNIKKFSHERPVIDFAHGNQSRTGIFSGNTATEIDIDNGSSPVNGVRFGGYSSIAGFWYTGDKWPLQYQNSYYHGDYAGQWIKQFKFNAVDTPTYVNHFADSVGAVVYMLQKNNDGCVHYVNYPFEIRKICYTGTVNNPPVAKAACNINYGASPLSIVFSASQSYDPNNDPITYSWNFGDGGSSSSITPSHTYIVGGNAVQGYWAVLTVSDNAGNSAKDSVFISVNNTPPLVDITSFNNGDFYSMGGSTNLPLQATVTDAQHAPGQLKYKWEVFLHHNTHEHPESADTNKTTSAIITPIGCNGETYYYRIRLTVTDAGGLSAFDEGNIYPNCCNNFTASVSPSGTTSVCAGSSITLTANQGVGYTYKWYRNNVLLSNTTATYSTGTAGTYKCVVSVATCSATSNSVVVNQINNPTPIVTRNTPLTFCAPGYVVLTANTFSGVTYQWENNSVPIPGATSSVYVANGPGLYRALETANGCSKYTNKVSVSAATSVSAAITTSDPTTLCSGGTVNMSVTNPIPGYSFQWKNNGLNIPGATAATYAASVSGSYTCTISASCGNNTSNAIAVSIGSFAAQVTPSGNVAICSGGSLVLTANTGTGFTYQWMNNGVNIPGETNPTLTVTTSGNYSVAMTSPCGNGTSAATNVTLATVTASLSPAGNSTVCSGTAQTFTANTGNGFTYRWFRNNVLLSATGATYTTSTDGSYKVEVSISGSCAVVSNTATLIVINNPTPTITASGPTTFCNGGNVTLIANTFTGVTYQWQKNAVNIPGATGQSYVATTTGSYRAQETKNGCSKFTPKKNVTVNNCAKTGDADFSEVAQALMRVSPNPFTNVLSVTIAATQTEQTLLQIVDVLGKVQFSQIINTNSTIDLNPQLPPGIYLMTAVVEGEQKSLKIIKGK